MPSFFAAVAAIATAAATVWLYPAALWAQRSVPEGFEFLAEPQPVLVDLYYSDRHIGAFAGVGSPTTFSFDDPAEVIEALPDIQPNKKRQLLIALTGDLPANANYICEPVRTPKCGKLPVVVAGVVYSADIFRVDLFVASEFRAVQHFAEQRYLALPNTGLSGLLTLVGAGNYSSIVDRPEYGANARAVVGYDENHVTARLSYVRDQPFLVQDLQLQRQHNWLRYTGGFFPIQRLRVAAGLNLLGAQVGTSLRTRLDIDSAQGTELQVFLPEPSTIIIRRDGRLISSLTYPAGNQILDTQALPAGVYEIDLEIVSQRGTTRHERRFFSKSNRLPIADTPNFWVAGGTITTTEERYHLPEVSNRAAVGFGWEHRYHELWGLGQNFMLRSDQSFTELGIMSQFSVVLADAFIVASTDGHIGGVLNATLALPFFSWSVDARLLSDPARGDFGPGGNREGAALQRRSIQLSSRANLQRGPVQLGLFGRWRRAHNEIDSHTIGADARWALWNSSTLYAALVLNASRTANDTLLTGAVEFRFTEPHWRFDVQGGGQIRDLHDDVATRNTNLNDGMARGRLVWSDDDVFSDDLEIQVQGERRSRVSSYGGGFDYEGTYGNIGASASQSTVTTLTSGTASVHVLIDDAGIVAGGFRSQQSGVIVDIGGEGDEGEFEVQIDGRVWRILRADSRAAILLTPYRQYAIALRPHGETLVQVDNSPRRVVLYPGNVTTLTWEPKRVFVVIGTAVDAAGDPITDARLATDQERSRTDDTGFFQISAATGDPIKVSLPDGATCLMKPPAEDADSTGVLVVDTLTCTSE